MAKLTREIIAAWEKRVGPVIFTTVSKNGIPNAIYASCVSLYDDETLIVADNHFHKTRANILSGSMGSLLFRTEDWKSYQIKGEIEYHTEGELFNDMKRWNSPHRAGHAAAVIRVVKVYSGATQLV